MLGITAPLPSVAMPGCLPSHCLLLAATQKALSLVSRARGGQYFSNHSSPGAGLPSRAISQPQGSNPRAGGTAGRVALVQLRVCPAGTLAPCRLPVDPKNLLATPRCLCQPPEIVQGFPGPQAAAVAPGKAMGSFPSTPPQKIPRLWLRIGSTAEAGLTWAALELEQEPDMA